jgi:purine-binding chemotaxis protein CheW
MPTRAQGDVEYVTAVVGGQHFGIRIERVNDVFVPGRITRVPLAPSGVAGAVNLRGRVVTLIDLRKRLDLPPRPAEAGGMVIGVDWNGDSYGLLVDSVGEVTQLPASSREDPPANLDPAWARAATGVHAFDDRIMVVLDVNRILEVQPGTLAA